MIQRIQSVYLLVVTILMIVCMCSPVGSIIANTNEISEFGNLCITMPDGTKDYAPWALFAILLVVAILSFVTIFLFKNLQQCRADRLLFGFGGIHLHVGRKYKLYSVMDYLLAVHCTHLELVGYPGHWS